MRRLAGRARLFLVSSFLTLALFTATASAQYRHRVVVLEPSGPGRYPELRARLRGELVAAGFDVVSVTAAPGEALKAAAERAAGEQHPAAVVWVVEPEPVTAEGETSAPDARLGQIWILDRLLPHTVVLTFDASAAGAGDATRVPVTAVEILKADLAELSVTRPPPPPPARAASPPPRHAPPPSSERRPWRAVVEPGFAFLAGFSGLPSTWTPLLRAGVELPATWEKSEPPVFELRARVAAFGGAVVVDAPEGQARVKQTLAGVEGVARLLPKSMLQPFFVVSAGAYSAHVAGKSATAPAHTATTWSFTTGGGLGLRFQLEPARARARAGWALAATGTLDVAWVPTAIRIAERRVATAGAPTGLLSAGLVGFF